MVGRDRLVHRVVELQVDIDRLQDEPQILIATHPKAARSRIETLVERIDTHRQVRNGHGFGQWRKRIGYDGELVEVTDDARLRVKLDSVHRLLGEIHGFE